MKLVLLASLCLAAGIIADKSFPSDLSHVVRVGKNGRQVIRSQGGRIGRQGPGGQVRKVVRKQRKQSPRQERQFLTPVAPAPVPNLFNPFSLPPAPAPAPVVAAPLTVATTAPLRSVAPAPAPVVATPFVAPLRSVAPVVAPAAPLRAGAPLVPFVHHHLPSPAIRIQPLPLAQPVVQVSHINHALPLPAPAASPVTIPAPAPAPALAPLPAPAVEIVDVKAVPLEYGAPSTVAPEVRTNYLAPVVEEAREAETGYLGPPAGEEAREAPNGYLGPQVEEAREAPKGYLGPAVEEVREASNGYLGPVADLIPDVSAPAPAPVVEVVELKEAENVDAGYIAPRDSYIAVPAAPVPVVEAKTTYLAAQPSVRVPNVAANVRATAKPKQIAIIRNILNPPTIDPSFDYSFESENGIKQEAVGTMRRVDDSDVAVMKGSYSYIGVDGQTYTVDWYADETGFHPSAPHLPRSVEPIHPEVAAAVRAQLEFAAQEEAAAAASRNAASYIAAEELPGYN